MHRRVLLAAVAAAWLVTGSLPGVNATFPLRRVEGGIYDYTKLHITNGACSPLGDGQYRPTGSDLPSNFDCIRDHKLTDYAPRPGDRDYDPLVAANPQEFFGSKGSSTNLAWEVTTGRPDVVIAVTDSGIRWDEDRTNLVNKFFLNRGELPIPGGSTKGGTVPQHDANADGVFNVADYASDARVRDTGGDENELIDPGDLVRAFSDGVDDDGNGYVDDISGWDFFEGDNDPNDDVDYGHGTGESEDSAGETETNLDPQCPNCMLMEMRVGDSFVADTNHFAEATIYATDNGASVIQSALGTLNHTSFAQAAADYAWNHGVLFVASAADEAAGHHNFPSALNHTMVVNSATPFVDGVQVPRTYLAFNGCTNYGGYIWLYVPSTSCSSDAVGQTAGIAGLVQSAARNAVDLGVIARDRSGQPLSAPEAKQVLRAAADDVDFSTPKPPGGPPNNFLTSLPGSIRYITTEGWDQITGWGRINANAAVRLVAAGRIPPEADLRAPRWWQPLPTRGRVEVAGRVAAPRASAFSYEVQVAPGVQPPRWPLSERWTTFGKGEGTAPIDGTLATLDMTAVRALIDGGPPVYTPVDDPTSRDLPERDAFRVRVVVRDNRADTPDAIEQVQAFAIDDPDLLPGFPRFLGGDGASSPAFEDLDGDGVDELVLPTGDGLVHAFKAGGTEAAGWPARTSRYPLPTTGRNGYTRGEVPSVVHSATLLGSAAIADLDGDGRPEVAVADLEGALSVFDNRGGLVPGFPVHPHEPFSVERACQDAPGAPCDDQGPSDARDELNTVDFGFSAAPSVGDLDPAAPGLELVAGANDGHVYAWHADGTPVPGWPVLLRDPAKVAAVDPVTHRVTYTEDSGARFGRKVISTPSLGDVDGDGDLEVAVNVNEEYQEAPNAAVLRDPVVPMIGNPTVDLNDSGNTRVYLLHHDGTARPPTADQVATAHPHDQAYVGGWPVPVPMLVLELLPYVGEGSNGAPVLADADGDGMLEIATASIAGPPLLLRADGTPALGTGPGGHAIALASLPVEFKSGATDGPSYASLGGGAWGRLQPGLAPSFVMGATGLRRLLDVVLPEQQLAAEDHVSAWNPVTGSYELGFPAQMNDLQFFNTPAVVDVGGDGAADVIQGSATYDVRAYGFGGLMPEGWPKQTGGWGVVTAAAGDLDADGTRDLAYVTREGNLFVWRTAADACRGAEWPKYAHDLHNTGNHAADGRRPGVVRGLTVDGPHVQWRAAGGDGPCGLATAYELLVDGQRLRVPATSSQWTAPGGGVVRSVTVWAIDAEGNRGFPTTYGLPTSEDVGALPATGAGSSFAWLLLAAALVIRRARTAPLAASAPAASSEPLARPVAGS
jgi:hypothetical protein